MQINSLQLKNTRKKRKTIGRGGKKGTYSGKGNKGQKARSGAHVDPLFEGGRSTLIDHMKKKKGFTARGLKKNEIKLSQLENKFKDGELVDMDSLIKTGLISKMDRERGAKIIGGSQISKKLKIFDGILLSKSSRASLEKSGGEIASKK